MFAIPAPYWGLDIQGPPVTCPQRAMLTDIPLPSPRPPLLVAGIYLAQTIPPVEEGMPNAYALYLNNQHFGPWVFLIYDPIIMEYK